MIFRAKRDRQTHDYTLRCWGHDYSIREVKRQGRQLKLGGWGDGIRKGDLLLLENRDRSGSVRYRVTAIEYCRDPTDMWFADVSFAPENP